MVDIIHRKYATKRILLVLPAVLLIVSLGSAIYFYRQYTAIKNNPDAIAQQEGKQLTQKISLFMDLPKNEAPSIATIVDKDKLNNQSFFANSENGDKLLIYTKTGQAILYRPSSNRIIAVAPISLQSSLPSPTPESTASPTKIAVYNGGEKAGLAELMKTKLSKAINNISLTTGNAQKTDYQKTLVVKMQNVSDSLLTQILEVTNGEISSLPSGEVKPDADILVIVSDQ